jgi:hypothetical protein
MVMYVWFNRFSTGCSLQTNVKDFEPSPEPGWHQRLTSWRYNICPILDEPALTSHVLLHSQSFRLSRSLTVTFISRVVMNSEKLFNCRLAFVVSKSNVWDMGRIYDVPDGWRWATTAEVLAEASNSTDKGKTYFNQAGWRGFRFEKVRDCVYWAQWLQGACLIANVCIHMTGR